MSIVLNCYGPAIANNACSVIAPTIARIREVGAKAIMVLRIRIFGTPLNVAVMQDAHILYRFNGAIRGERCDSV